MLYCRIDRIEVRKHKEIFPMKALCSCGFLCGSSYQWILGHVGPVSVYCDDVGRQVICLLHWIPEWQHNKRSKYHC